MESLPTYLSGFLAIILFTSFVKVLTALEVVRFGMGLQGAGFGLVMAAISLALSLLIMQPQLEPLGGVDALLSGKLDSQRVTQTVGPFMQRHTDQQLLQRFDALSKRVAKKGNVPSETAADTKPVVSLAASNNGNSATSQPQTSTKAAAQSTSQQPTLPVLVAAFVVSQVRDAFTVGFMVLIPFVVIDLLVANILTALAITALPVVALALPLKILLFISVDGWKLLSEKLIVGYV